MKYIPILVVAVGLVVAPLGVVADEVTGNVSTGVGSGNEAQGVVVTAPAVSPAAGTYTSNQSVTLTASGSSGICYTTNGDTPVCAAAGTTCTTGTLYSSAISITGTTTVKAKSCYPNNNQSSQTSATYTLQCSTTSVSNGSVGSYPGCAITCSAGYTLSGSSCNANGGGGGGGGGAASYTGFSTTPAPTTPTTPVTPQQQLANLLAQLATLQAQLAKQKGTPAPTTPTTPVTPSVGGGTITSLLTVGSQGSQVVTLQTILVAKGFLIMPPGVAMGYFGNATKAAVQAFQASQGISQVGYTGPATRAALNAAAGGAPTAPAPAVQGAQTTAPSAPAVSGELTQGLELGAQGSQVELLQQLLIARGLLSADSATGYFGPMTKAAVEKFQEQNSLAFPGDDSYGYVGPKTREALNRK